ncbi:hypothetical protein SAMN04489726_5260 [Allokutzneria albata]|uniref:Uncharacterized protein n=1 Tax=Allokutzneria albata TaxID=211114 RepID=A0A1G9Z4U9_ALLAB|nr:hypothetical protein SAMN04489726_5260 [Allokutzneria albata]
MWRPKTVEFAYWLSLVSALSAFASLIYLFGLREEMTAGLREAVQRTNFLQSENQEAFVRSAVSNTLIFATVIVTVIGCAMITFAVMMRRGRNWARIVVTVVAVLGLGGMTTSVNGVVLSSPGPLALLTFAVNIAVIVLLYVPASNRYFARPKP